MNEAKELILEWLKENQRSREWLAKEIGKGSNWFRGWLRGQTDYISKETLQSIANLTDIKFEKLCPSCNRPMDIKPKEFLGDLDNPELPVDKEHDNGTIPK